VNQKDITQAFDQGSWEPRTPRKKGEKGKLKRKENERIDMKDQEKSNEEKAHRTTGATQPDEELMYPNKKKKDDSGEKKNWGDSSHRKRGRGRKKGCGQTRYS